MSLVELIIYVLLLILLVMIVLAFMKVISFIVPWCICRFVSSFLFIVHSILIMFFC